MNRKTKNPAGQRGAKTESDINCHQKHIAADDIGQRDAFEVVRRVTSLVRCVLNGGTCGEVERVVSEAAGLANLMRSPFGSALRATIDESIPGRLWIGVEPIGECDDSH